MLATLLSRAIALPARLHNRLRRVSAGRPPRDQRHAARTERGQSLVEFALVLPMLLVLLLGVADFGRVFNANIVTESAARDSAEMAAEYYLRNPPGSLSGPPVPPPNYYVDLHNAAAKTVCTEMRQLPGVSFDEATGTCSGPMSTLVCVHDGADDSCTVTPGAVAGGTCSLTPAANTPGAEEASRRWVEVKVCYTFSPAYKLLVMPIVGYTASDVHVQRSRAFTIPDY
jgi:hypothetical protein